MSTEAPTDQTHSTNNIMNTMKKIGIHPYSSFQQWSSEHRESFWEMTTKLLNISFKEPYKKILNIEKGIEKASWYDGAKINIAESCFNAQPEQKAIKFQRENGALESISYGELKVLAHKIGNSFQKKGFRPGDAIAIYMPMTCEAVASYLGAIFAGLQVVTIADSFAPQEIKIRLDIIPVKIVLTQDVIYRSGKEIPLYQKVKDAGDYPCAVISTNHQPELNSNDIHWSDFLSSSTNIHIHYASPEETVSVLFSSGTTGHPKAIPWNHTTPVKSASDGYYHHNIQPGDTLCWPTNLGWMMGPWLVFATLINRGTIALYYGAPLNQDFGGFVEAAQVNMLGVVPSMVRSWKSSRCMENKNWSQIKCFSSTGECSNPDDMTYLMKLAGNKPVIEYCGGTETGGAYITSTLLQENIPATFSTVALGGDFIILDEDGLPTDNGEVFLLPPTMGLSTKLLNRDHHEVYYQGTPKPDGKLCRRHGDQIERLPNNYFKAKGRVDDALNLGGIKVSSVQIEECINQLPFVRESAAVGISPSNGGPDQLVICYIENSPIDPKEAHQQIQTIVKEKLNPLFKVVNCVQMKAFPRTVSNKIMRRKLREDTQLD
jgi:acetyl-CoA synthetase